jgi:type II secretory pathway component PulM
VKGWWAGLAIGERRALSLLAVVLVVVGGYAGVLEPLHQAEVSARQRLAAAEQLERRVRSIADAAVRLRASASPTPVETGEPLLSLVESTSRGVLGTAVERINPTPQGGVQVRMGSVAFDALTAWLVDLSLDHGVGVEQISVADAGAPGTVRAEVTLARR